MEVFDPFMMLGLPRAVELDAWSVQRAYLERSSTIHPDLSGADLGNEEQTAQLNRAREILMDSEQRMVSLWRLLMADANVVAGPSSGIDDRSLPQGFLVEMMETREAIESAIASKDSAVLTHWEQWALDQRCERARSVGRMLTQAMAMSSSSPSPPLSSLLSDIKRELNAWRYIERLIEQVAGQHPM